MKITDDKQHRENWSEALSLWNRVVNWSHYNTSQRELTQQIKSLLMFLWNKKDWLKKEHPSKSKVIEEYINQSKYIKVVGDLANTIKHRVLTQAPRSEAKQTDYYGKVQLGKDKERLMYYIQIEENNVVEVFQILRGALDEYEELHYSVKML